MHHILIANVFKKQSGEGVATCCTVPGAESESSSATMAAAVQKDKGEAVAPGQPAPTASAA